MRCSLVMVVCAAVLLLRAASGRADFPAVEQLPANPDFPDPLAMLDGKKVTNAEEWFKKRRPELQALFQHYMYGYAPPAPARIDAKVERKDPNYFGGKATKKEVTIRFGPPEVAAINLLLVIPNDRKKPAPVFVGMSFCGNYAIVDDPAIPLPAQWMYPNQPGVVNNRATEGGRGKQKDVWALEQSIDRGYAVATFYNGDIDPDRPNFEEGIQPQYLKKGQTKPGPHDWGAIAAWAWGIQRAVDYLVTDKDLDPKRIAVFGHSRLGKTALVAAAFDERIALAIPHQAGCGGTAPSRTKNPKSETVQRINTSFPHWFNATFKEFNDHVERLPFDQHCLVALVAPRPVLFTNAVDDQWANPDGQFDVLKAADPVYRYLGVDGLNAERPPELGKLVSSRLGYFIRLGKHSTTPQDWKVFLDFADKHLAAAKRR